MRFCIPCQSPQTANLIPFRSIRSYRSVCKASPKPPPPAPQGRFCPLREGPQIGRSPSDGCVFPALGKAAPPENTPKQGYPQHGPDRIPRQAASAERFLPCQPRSKAPQGLRPFWQSRLFAPYPSAPPHVCAPLPQAPRQTGPSVLRPLAPQPARTLRQFPPPPRKGGCARGSLQIP